MGILRRICGICDTKPPGDRDCWARCDDGIEVDLSRVPELAEAGSAVRIEDPSLSQRVLLVNGKDGEFHALPNRCSHGGRRLDPRDGYLECCSVGRSLFGYDGRRHGGPAPSDLSAFEVEQIDGKLRIRFG